MNALIKEARASKNPLIQTKDTAFVSGLPREITKTFRISEDLAYSLKKYAVESRQTEKDILVNLVSGHLKNVGAI